MLDQKSKPFGKLFAHTWTGSMAWQPPVVYAVWAYAIAHAKPPLGLVEINVQTISRAFIKDSVENIQAAVDYLCSPDPNSRNKTEDGRRMIHLGAFDYQIVNFPYYRDAQFLDEKRANDAQRQRDHRNKLKNQAAGLVTPNVTRHTECHSPSQCVAPPEAEAEAEAEAECVQPVKETGNPPPIGGGKGEPGVKGDTSPPPPPPGGLASGEAKVGGSSSLFPELGPGPEPKTKKPKTSPKPKGWDPTPQQLRLGALYRRLPTTRWSDKELRAFHNAKVEDGEIDLIEVYYEAVRRSGSDISRRDLVTLLNNWQGELDRARHYVEKSENQTRQGPNI